MKKAQVLSVAYTVALWVPLPASLTSLLLSLAQGLCMYYFLCLQCSVLGWVITFPRKTSLTSWSWAALPSAPDNLRTPQSLLREFEPSCVCLVAPVPPASMNQGQRLPAHH